MTIDARGMGTTDVMVASREYLERWLGGAAVGPIGWVP